MLPVVSPVWVVYEVVVVVVLLEGKNQYAAPVMVVAEYGRLVVLTPPAANNEFGGTLIGPSDMPRVRPPSSGSCISVLSN